MAKKIIKSVKPPVSSQGIRTKPRVQPPPKSTFQRFNEGFIKVDKKIRNLF